FPAPGDETRLNAATSCAASRARTCAAKSSLRAITRSRTSIVWIAIVHLQVRDLEHVASTAHDGALCAAERRCREHGIEAELQGRRLDASRRANLHGDRDEPGCRV